MWRIEAPKVIAGLARMVDDIGLAEESAQDALVAALEQWPRSGVPENPGAWLMATAKRRAIDALRRRQRFDRKLSELGNELETQQPDVARDVAAALEEEIGDDVLTLVFTACHPVLSTPARVALTLRVLCGLTTGEIARAFLVPEPTVAQRIVRAKRTLVDRGVSFAVPCGQELTDRLPAVLEVLYLVFNEGYTATSGNEWSRPELCEEALRLGRMVAERIPGEPEAHGLVALLELQHSRSRARVGPGGEAVPLLEQNRGRWDQLLVRRGLAELERAHTLVRKRGATSGPYVLQADIAACHARAPRPEETNWPRIAALYTALAGVAPSPVVELNRAVALAMVFGPERGLDLVDELAGDPALRNYHLLPSVRGDLLVQLERFGEARAEFERAADLTRNERERALLLDRAAACAAGTATSAAAPPPTPSD